MGSSPATHSEWPFISSNYAPDLDDGHELYRVLERWWTQQLSESTVISLMSPTQDLLGIVETTLDAQELNDHLHGNVSEMPHRVFFIYKHLVRDKKARVPDDANKLRISRTSFQAMATALDLPPSFAAAIAQSHLPHGNGFNSSWLCTLQLNLSFWYVLPVRVQFQCNDVKQAHALSSAGNNQMNPHHFLHLPDAGLDVRGSHIALFSRFDVDPNKSTTVAINFMDGRWTRSAEEPQRRLQETVSKVDGTQLWQDPFFVHSIYLTSSLRWWMNALSSINDQLIAYERRLQGEIDTQTRYSDAFNTINRALHAVAGHLHRYSSELTYTNDVIISLRRQQKLYRTAAKRQRRSPMYWRVTDPFERTESQIKHIRTFVRELEVKLQNILALLFHRIQLTNDRLVVRNGEQMSSILSATQEEARASRDMADEQAKLAISMREDSIAMKSIAVTTMFFLPGTSFAALFAMPFFSQNPYITDTTRIWIWVVCTVPSTLAAFAFYFYSKWTEAPKS